MKKLFSLLLAVILLLPMGACAEGGEMMANYLYNGVELPALPEWDTTKYPYAVMALLHPDTEIYALYCCSEIAWLGELTYGNSVFYNFGMLCPTVIVSNVKGRTGEWTAFSEIKSEPTSGYFGFPILKTGEEDTWKAVWTNVDLVADNSVVFAASNPIRLDSKLSISVKPTISYHGVELPSLPDMDDYFVLILGESGIYHLLVTSVPTTRGASDGSEANYFRSPKSTYRAVYYLPVGQNTWETSTERKYLSTSSYFTVKDALYEWANYDVLFGSDESIYIEKSDPVPCPQASFTCSNLNETNSVYKIAAWCYPKGTSYLNAPHTYVSAANFAGKNHSESWTLPALTEGTEYELYAAILVDDVATDHNALVTFTADGTVAELDFTNATLSVETGVVQHNSYTFKLAYSGLPYNADGTSAVFDIAAVTDAGDRAYMGGKITSGSGTVNGTFADLEPLTDYTATFEVYYNGKPTGVTATASFTTEEEHTPGDTEKRDSFHLGFASGLCGMPITEADAEYNTWAQGYIVGSALRKAL